MYLFMYLKPPCHKGGVTLEGQRKVWVFRAQIPISPFLPGTTTWPQEIILRKEICPWYFSVFILGSNSLFFFFWLKRKLVSERYSVNMTKPHSAQIVH